MYTKRSTPASNAQLPIPSSAASSVVRGPFSTSNPLVYAHGLTGTNQYGNYLFVNAVVVFFFGLCTLSLALRLAKMWDNHLRHLFASGQGRTGDRQLFWTYNHAAYWPWVKRNLISAPVWKQRHNREIQLSSAISMGTLPSRLQALLLVAFVATNISYCVVLDYSQSRDALLAELRGRSGSLAAINLIPTILFALRNNPLIWLLRLSYDSFNLLHRWTARIVIAEAIVHTLAWAYAAASANGFSSVSHLLRATLSFRWGLTATVLFTAIAIQACSPVRHAFYETFLTAHRILALFGIIGVWVHLDTAHLPQLPYVQLGLVLWIGEWTLRSLWIVMNSYNRRLETLVTVEALPSEACRITFQLARQWEFLPGCHVHAYLPSVAWWSSHPFSVAWSRDAVISDADSDKTSSGDFDLDRKELLLTSISLVVRARTGATRKLFEKAASTPGGVVTLSGAIEGPYGGHESLDSYGTVLLFAGGVGITHQIGYIRHLLHGFEQGTVATRKVILVWSVPNTEALDWIRSWMDEILRMSCRREMLKILLFVTKPRSQQEVVSGTGTVQMFPGRCDPQTIVDREFEDRVGAMMVTVCGPGGFSDSVRQAVRNRMMGGLLDFVEEQFTY